MTTAATLRPFLLERFFAKYEFGVKHLLCPSDSEPLSMQMLLQLADEDSLQRYNDLNFAYTDTQGLPLLRQEIAARLYTSEITHEMICIAAPQELVSLAFNAICKPGMHVVCTMPGYQSLYEIPRALGCCIHAWEPEVDAETGAHFFNVDRLAHLLASIDGDSEDVAADGEENGGIKEKLVVINFPHNPTGFLPSKDDFKRIVELCKQHNAWIFSDEMYRFLEFEPENDRLPSIAEIYPSKGITLSGLSKWAGLPGLRVGWLASQNNAFLQRVLELKDYSSICTAASSEVFGLMAIRQWERIVEGQMGILRDNIRAIEDMVGRHPGLMQWTTPKAGTISFPKLLVSRTKRTTDEEDIGVFCEALIQEAGIVLLPATVYENEQAIKERRFRLGFGRKNFKQGLAALEEHLLSISS